MLEASLPAKKKNPKESAAGPGAEVADPREALPQNRASWQQTREQLARVLADLTPPPEPRRPDLIEAMLHVYFADGLPCGYGQEARRRIAAAYVDRNEFRVTEAYEVEDLLQDLQIPDLFQRCLWVRESVAQIYNDQNGVNLDFLYDAGVGDRANFFQRTPALRPHVVTFLTNLLTVEELCFSDKSTARVQARLGMDAKDEAAQEFVTAVRGLVRPFGHLPLEVGKDLPHGKPNLAHTLSPACLLVRLLPGPKPGRKRS